MGQRIVGQKDPWLPGFLKVIALMLTGAVLIAIVAWGNWPRT